MRTKKIFAGASTALLILIVAMSMVSGADDTSSMTVNVNSKTIIDLLPGSASFSGDPGTATTPIWTNFTIENVGSSDITNVYANVTQPASDPFTGVNTDAGNLIGIRNKSSGPLYMVDRKEYNRSTPTYVTRKSACDNNTGGRIHLDNEEFFWCADANEGAGSGTYEDGNLYISDTAHNKTQLGDIDLSDNTGISLSSIQGGSFGASDVTLATKPTNEKYCVALAADGSHLRITHWNYGIESGSVCSNDHRLNGGSTFSPGALLDLDVRARIPYGLTGATSGTLKIIAN